MNSTQRYFQYLHFDEMSDTAARMPECKEDAEALLQEFTLTRILKQDDGGRRINILGVIKGEQGILTLERAAFPTEEAPVTTLIQNLTSTTNLGANDVYRWYLSNNAPSLSQYNVKVNLIWPCTDVHIRKYAPQQVRYVTETPEIYATHIKPWIESTQRTEKRLGWIYNILDGITEQESIVYRSVTYGQPSSTPDCKSEGFLLLPDLNWDRLTATSLHLLALVERRDLWSLRGLKRKHVPWLKHLQQEIVRASAAVAAKLVPKGSGLADVDQFKCYVHYQPTYYHFHVHVVHIMLEAGATQAVGKAFSLEGLISQLEHIEGGEEAGMEKIDVSYSLGEESDVWKKCYSKLKVGESVILNDD